MDALEQITKSNILVSNERVRPVKMEGLFPIPIGFSSLDRPLTDVEKNYLLNQKTRPNYGNTTSENSYVLRSKGLAALRQFIEDGVDDYARATLNPVGNVRFKITQSWVNYSEPGQHHHKHSHSNAVISGCFYVNASADTDRIYFYKDGYQQIKLPPAEWNMFNSDSWWFSVETGMLVLFPSSLTHMVQTVQSEETRISLAFNVFPFGSIGDELSLTDLQLYNK